MSSPPVCGLAGSSSGLLRREQTRVKGALVSVSLAADGIELHRADDVDADDPFFSEVFAVRPETCTLNPCWQPAAAACSDTLRQAAEGQQGHALLCSGQLAAMGQTGACTLAGAAQRSSSCGACSLSHLPARQLHPCRARLAPGTGNHSVLAAR